MAVVVDVRGVVRVLRQLTSSEIIVELLGVHNLGAAGGIVADVVERDEGVVLAVVGSLVRSRIALIGEILHIALPRHIARLHQVHKVGVVQVVHEIVKDHPVISSNYATTQYRADQQK